MIIPNLMASESTYSYVFRLARLNGLLTGEFFYQYILMDIGKFVSRKKLVKKLFDWIGESHPILFDEASKRILSAPNNHCISYRYPGEPVVTLNGENQFKSVRYCALCMADQHFGHGHSWLKRDWLFNSNCFVHQRRLLTIDDTASKLKLSYIDTFKHILEGSSLDFRYELTNVNNQYENRSSILAPCVLIEYFKSKKYHGNFDFSEYDSSYHNRVSLFYQYINCFPCDEKVSFKLYLENNIDAYLKDGFYFYKARLSCIECPFKTSCLYVEDYTMKSFIDEMDIKRILDFVFQCSDLPEYITKQQISVYSDFISHLNEFFDPLSYEAEIVGWILTLMKSTFGTHSELITRENDLTFNNLKRDSISGLLVLTLKREKRESPYRSILLHRSFEEKMKKFVDKRFNGIFCLNIPLVASKSGLVPIQPGDLNRIIIESVKSFDAIPANGRNLNCVRNAIACSAIAAGANIHYVMKSSGLVHSKLIKEGILPIDVSSTATILSSS